MKNEYNADLEKGFLPIEGSRVLVIGTRFNGFWGEVVSKPKTWSSRSIAVQLDDWEEIVKLYRNNMLTEFEMLTRRIEQ